MHAKTQRAEVVVANDQPYVMRISLNVLNHLGLNLYSNASAVLAEVVANSYDADAENVYIWIDSSLQRITVQDDGEGMGLAEINERYLNVGYQRRRDRAVSPRFGRPVMGRKGIGKLSLFSIADTIEVHTAKGGEKHALRMSADAIRAAIGSESPETATPYRPERLDPSIVDFDKGTRIVLSRLKKGTTNLARGLRKRLARRFSVLGEKYSFRLHIDGTEVTVGDRDYFHKLQYVWLYGDEDKTGDVASRCTSVEKMERMTSPTTAGGVVTGWIGTVANAGSLKEQEGNENLNKICLMIRGKLAHEDLLEEFNEGKIFRAYLIGELHADFLDKDDEDDIATSSRQRIVEDDPRYQDFLKWLRTEITRIGSAWTEYRNEAGTAVALQNPLISEWFETLQGDSRKKAKRLFGKINQLTLDNERQRTELFAHAVLAFETLRYRDNLDALDGLEPSDLSVVTRLFTDMADLESALYHQIVVQRLRVIQKLQEHIEENALEAVLQKHLFENLWLLDPSWERATDRAMEERVGTAFKEISDQLSEHEKASRIDIRYKKVTGAHVIVELKRHSVVTSTPELLAQVGKYRDALLRYLRDVSRDEPVQIMCVVGKDLSDWAQVRGKEYSDKSLEGAGIRVVKYEQLLADAKAGYQEYLDREREELGRVRKLLDSLAAEADKSDQVS